MTISDQSRYRLHQRLDDIIGVDEAATLMEHLPPVGWADVGTKRDLEHTTALTQANIDQLGSALRIEMGELRTEVRVGFADVRTELQKELGAMRGQLQTLFLGLVGLQITAAGLAVTLSHVL